MAEGGDPQPGSKPKKRSTVERITSSVEKLKVTDISEEMNFDSLKQSYLNKKQDRLKHDIISMLKGKGAKGVPKATFWNELQKTTNLPSSYKAADYGLRKMQNFLDVQMADIVESFTFSDSSNKQQSINVRLKSLSNGQQASSLNFNEEDFPLPGATGGKLEQSALGARPKETRTKHPPSSGRNSSETDPKAGYMPAVDLTDQNSQDPDYLDIQDEASKTSPICPNWPSLQPGELSILKTNTLNFLTKKQKEGKNSVKFFEFLQGVVYSTFSKDFGRKVKTSPDVLYDFIGHTLSDLLVFEHPNKKLRRQTVKLKTSQHISGYADIAFTSAVAQQPRNAMSLMSSLSGWGKPAVAQAANTNENAHKRERSEDTVIDADKQPDLGKQPKKQKIPSQQFISLIDDDDEDVDISDTRSSSTGSRPQSRTMHERVIEIRDESPQPGPSGPTHGVPAAPIQLPMFCLQNPGQQAAKPSPLLSPLIPQLQFPMQPRMQQNLQGPPLLTGNFQALGGATIKPNNNPFAINRRNEPEMPGFRDEVIDLTANPVDQTLFEPKPINLPRVFVPHGQTPHKDFVNTAAQECIDAIAEANEHVTLGRIQDLLCQRFQCYNIRQLGVFQIDHLPCVNDLNRLINKINAYILGFVKTRSICSLYELKECLREYVPNKEEFEKLKCGPLQRFPVVYQQFRFPPDFASIPEITSMDILDHFHNYLTKFQMWTKRLELEPFMDYLVEEYHAGTAYMLGVRIRSLPLAAGVLKKAQRDCGNNRREVVEHYKTALQNEIEDAFRKFRASMLRMGTGEGLEVRTHYLKMRPQLVLLEICEKFNLLLVTTEMGQRSSSASYKLKRVIETFITEVRKSELACTILHLAICMSSTQLEESALALLQPQQQSDGGAEGVSNHSDSNNKPPPKKESLVGKLRMYIERCLNAGSLSLAHLERIEQKLLEDFEFSTFNMMGCGRFLEFLLAEAKQMIEEGGGMLLGSSSSHSDSDVSFKPRQEDLLDFIRQCKACGQTQPSEIEESLCRQFCVKEARLLGHGNITRLLSYAEKHGNRSYGSHSDLTVIYENTLATLTGPPTSSASKVGILGHQTRDAAKICLHNCPLLADLAAWSQWDLVFEPELGKLKDFVQKYGGITNKPMEGGRMAELDFMGLELKPGHLIKIVSNTSPNHFAQALERRDILSTSGHLASMAVSHKGVSNMPIALLTSHMKTALLQMHAGESDSGESLSVQHAACLFVLQCLLHIPTRLCVALANPIFLDPLGQVVGSVKSKQLLVQLCKTVTEVNQLIELGCLLGIQEWTGLVQQKCVLQESFVQVSQDLYGESEAVEQVEDEQAVESSDNDDDDDDLCTEDVDEILAGELEEGTGHRKEGAPTGTDAGEAETAGPSTGDSADTVTKEAMQQDDDVTMEESSVADDTVAEVKAGPPTCEDIVNQIRKDEFGIGIHLSEDGQRLMKVQQERLGRSLDRLSKDLYSKDTHFVLELVQNADDNSYHDDLLDNSSSTDECPAVKFVINPDGIMVMNNEKGFREKDIRALCDVGRSTKGKHKFGYIGQKGIGFKSVFRVTDAPEVHSNGYHIVFDVNSGPMGYILPHWLPDDNTYPKDDWMTHIFLKLKADMRLHTRTLAARFNDIHPSLLLFLHRLRKITIENQVEHSVQSMRRRDMGDGIVQIKHSGGVERWLVVKKMLDASKISQQAKSGAEVESTEIALAFPLRKDSSQRDTMIQLPPKQPVFAFLPLRSYGFRFIVQGDFDVPSSREDVDRDSSWNQWLRNEIHTLFLDALDVFKSHKEFSHMEAVCSFLQFVPMQDEVLDFFKPVASDILKKLKAKPCVPTQPNSQGEVLWKMPSQTVRVRDPLVRSVITPALLETHLNLHYLHGDVAAMLNVTLTSCLGIETLTSEHLYQLGKALIVQMGTHCGSDNDVVLIAKWLACMYRSLDEFQQDDSILATIKIQKLLPLSTNELVSLQEKAVFYPIPDSSRKRTNNKDPMYHLQQDVSSLHPLLLNTGDSEVNSQVHKLLLRLGIKQLSPFDVINHHILPVLKSEAKQEKSPPVLVSYLIYIKEQTDKQTSLCNLDDLKDVAMVMTNQGLKTPKDTPVHFPPAYGNQIDLQSLFSGYEWTLLDTCYLPRPATPTTVNSWHSFFSKLGVQDFISVRQTDVTLTQEQLARSVWSSESQLWAKECEEYVVKDYSSVELECLIKENKHRDSSENVYAEQMRALYVLLGKHWESSFSRFCVTSVLDNNGKVLKETEASFSILLKNESWLPAFQRLFSVGMDKSVDVSTSLVFRQPSKLFLKSPVIYRLLSDNVLYVDVPVEGSPFSQFLGLKNSVAVETVKSALLSWSERENEDVPKVFITALEHMKNVYKFLSGELKMHEFQELLQQYPVLFVPDRGVMGNRSASLLVAGKMMSKNEVWLADKTGLFDKHQKLLEEYHMEFCKKRTIEGYYNDSPDLIEQFRNQGKLDSQPKVDEYMELLILLCTVGSPKDAAILSDVLYIFTIIGQVIATWPANTVNVIKNTVKQKLLNKKVFPTKDHRWVSALDKPLVADNREWETMFTGKDSVHFLDMEGKERGAHQGRGPHSQRQQRGKAVESRLKPEMIDVVIEVCGIQKLSEVVDSMPAPQVVKPCDRLQVYFHKIVPHVQQFLMGKFDDVYQQLEQRNICKMLRDAKFYQTGMLEVTYSLKDRVENKDTYVTREEKCVIQVPAFYFHENSLDSIFTINKEVARYFSDGDTACSNALMSFLSELNQIVSGDTMDTIEDLLRRHDADLTTELGEDEVWQVEAPPEPKPVLVVTEPEPEPMYEEPQPVEHSEGGAAPSDQPMMRAWPPVADNRTMKPRAPERPSSNIWPPPQAKDYMQSLRSLPSNIRVVDQEQVNRQKTEEGSINKDDGESASKENDSDLKSPGKGGHPGGVAMGGHSSGTVMGSNSGVVMRSVSTDGSQAVRGQGAGGPSSEMSQGVEGATETSDQGITLSVDGDQSIRRKRQLSDGNESQQEVKRRSGSDIDGPQVQAEGNEATAHSGDGNAMYNSGVRNMYRYPAFTHQATYREESPKKMKKSGDPIWTYMATDYSYDELGTGQELGLPMSLTLTDSAADPEIGKWGEALVKEYLERQKALGNILDFTWNNEDEESGGPFDFEVQFQDENGLQSDFIEVKSTRSDDREVFEISVQQIKFADEKAHHFHIFRVFNAGSSEKVRLIRITDVNMRLSQKQVKLCMLI